MSPRFINAVPDSGYLQQPGIHRTNCFVCQSTAMKFVKGELSAGTSRPHRLVSPPEQTKSTLASSKYDEEVRERRSHQRSEHQRNAEGEIAIRIHGLQTIGTTTIGLSWNRRKEMAVNKKEWNQNFQYQAVAQLTTTTDVSPRRAAARVDWWLVTRSKRFKHAIDYLSYRSENTTPNYDRMVLENKYMMT